MTLEYRWLKANPPSSQVLECPTPCGKPGALFCSFGSWSFHFLEIWKQSHSADPLQQQSLASASCTGYMHRISSSASLTCLPPLSKANTRSGGRLKAQAKCILPFFFSKINLKFSANKVNISQWYSALHFQVTVQTLINESNTRIKVNCQDHMF